MSKAIPLSVPCIRGNEWKYIKECLDTEWVSSVGSYVTRFENDICKYVGAKHAIACVNGTAALHMALIIAGVKPGDEVIVPSLTFIAPVNAVRYVGAEPVFMDSDEYYNIDVVKVGEFIRLETVVRNGTTYNRTSGKRIAAIIPVHIFGNAVDFEGIIDLLIERNIKVIEDATESLGTRYIHGKYADKHTGTIGDIGCISFNGNKIITTGGGGMIITDNDEMANKARYLTTQAKDDEIYYIHHEVGYNYRLTNIQAAMGVAQLEQLDFFLERKRENYKLYVDNIKDIAGLQMAESPSYAVNNHWLYPMLIDNNEYGMSRDKLLQYLASHNIQTRPVWTLNHLQKPYATNTAYKIERAYDLIKNTLELPCGVSLSENDISFVIERLKYA
jgi:perosamine synthetase